MTNVILYAEASHKNSKIEYQLLQFKYSSYHEKRNRSHNVVAHFCLLQHETKKNAQSPRTFCTRICRSRF